MCTGKGSHCGDPGPPSMSKCILTVAHRKMEVGGGTLLGAPAQPCPLSQSQMCLRLSQALPPPAFISRKPNHGMTCIFLRHYWRSRKRETRGSLWRADEMTGAPAKSRGLEATERQQFCRLAGPQGPGTTSPEPANHDHSFWREQMVPYLGSLWPFLCFLHMNVSSGLRVTFRWAWERVPV